MAEETASIQCPLASEIGWSDSDARLVWEGCFLKPKRAYPKPTGPAQGGCWCIPSQGRAHPHSLAGFGSWRKSPQAYRDGTLL